MVSVFYLFIAITVVFSLFFMTGFSIVFAIYYGRTKQKMFLYLIFFLLTNIFCNFASLGYLFSTNEEQIILYFIISEIFYLLTFYSLILLLEVFEKNIEFSLPQTVITMLVFIIVGLLLSNPDISVDNRGGLQVASFSDDSLVLILEVIIYSIAGPWILITLIRSRKRVKSQKQKTLITRLTLGIIFTSFIPLLFLVFEIPSFEPIYPYIIAIISLSINIGIFFIGFGFHQLRKYPWLMQKQKVFLLLVYNRSGLNLFHKVYDEKLKSNDSSLLAGGFTAVSLLITKATHSEGQVKSIILEGKELKIINKKYFICALIVEYSTQASEIAHKNFTKDFEKKFSKELKSFNGEISIFDSAEELALKYFS